MRKQTQVMIDMVFSFGELGFQEVETSKYLTGILEKEGFRIERHEVQVPEIAKLKSACRQTNGIRTAEHLSCVMSGE